MNVRNGSTPLLPSSFLQTTDDNGQMASTICADESRKLFNKGPYTVYDVSYQRGCRQR